MRLDAHQHFWSLANAFTDWPTPEMGEIHRDFGPGDLEAILAANNISGTILVQASPSIEETSWCLSIADKHDFVRGVVGWIDFESHDALDQMDRLACHPKLVGLRPMVQSITESGWLLREQFEPVFLRMMSNDLRLDGLVLHHQICDLTVLAGRYPGLSIVLDHAGKPRLRTNDFKNWSREIESLAAHPNVFCKLSGLWTEAGDDHSTARLLPWVAHLLDCFGADRLMWGSDWPVLNLIGTYSQWHHQCEQFLLHLSADERAGVFGDNGKQFYGIV